MTTLINLMGLEFFPSGYTSLVIIIISAVLLGAHFRLFLSRTTLPFEEKPFSSCVWLLGAALWGLYILITLWKVSPWIVLAPVALMAMVVCFFFGKNIIYGIIHIMTSLVSWIDRRIPRSRLLGVFLLAGIILAASMGGSVSDLNSRQTAHASENSVGGSAPIAKLEIVAPVKANNPPKQVKTAQVAKKPVAVKPAKAKQLSQKKAVQPKPVKTAQVAKKPVAVKPAKAKARKQAAKPDDLARYLHLESKRINASCPAPKVRQNLVRLVGYISKQGDNGISPAVLNGRRSLFTPTMNGVYKGGPLHTAINRMQNYSKKNGLVAPKWADHALYENNPEAFYDVSLRDQQALVLVNLAEQIGSDAMLKEVACGKPNGASTISLYLENHHKAPKADPVSWAKLIVS